MHLVYVCLLILTCSSALSLLVIPLTIGKKRSLFKFSATFVIANRTLLAPSCSFPGAIKHIGAKIYRKNTVQKLNKNSINKKIQTFSAWIVTWGFSWSKHLATVSWPFELAKKSFIPAVLFMYFSQHRKHSYWSLVSLLESNIIINSVN